MSRTRALPDARPWWALAGASLAVAGFVGMGEAGAVILGATPNGQFSVSSLYGVGQLTQLTTPATATLNGWASEQRVDPVWGWLLAHLGFDLLFIIGSGLLAVTMLRAASAARAAAARVAGTADAPTALASVRRWRPGYVLLGLVIGADLVQVSLAAAAAIFWIRRQRQVPAWLGWSLHLATVAKWAAAIVILLWAGYRILNTPYLGTGLGRLAQAVKQQRFSLVILVLLAVIAISRGSDVLEQMPDVERAWLTARPSLGWVHLAAAVTAQLLLAVLLLYLGRLRVRRAREKFDENGEHRAPARAWHWLLIPAGVLAVTEVLSLLAWARVSWPGALGIPLVTVPVAAFWCRRRASEAPIRDLRKAADAAGLVDLVRTVGDLLAVAVVAMAGLGLVRAFTAPALVLRNGYAWADRAAVVIGVAVAFLAWVAARLALGRAKALLREPAKVPAPEPARGARAGEPGGAAFRTGRGEDSSTGPGEGTGTGPGGTAPAAEPDGAAPAPPPGGAVPPEEPAGAGPGRARTPVLQLARWTRRVENRDNRPWLMLGATAVLAAADLLLVFVPLWTTHWLGVLGTAVIGLSTLTLGLAGLAELAQRYQPPPVFRLMRLSSTPVISLVLVAGIFSMVINRNSPLHDIRPPSAAARAAAQAAAGATSAGPPASTTTAGSGPAAAPGTLAYSLDQWLDSPLTKSCAIPRPVSPSAAAPRIRVEPLILVAASGGGIRAAWWAVHTLTMLARTQCGRHGIFAVSSVSGGSVGLGLLATSPRPDQAVARVAGPSALAASIDGLLLRDTIASYTGLDLTAAGMPEGQRYPDRAALMEQVWETEEPGLRQPFPIPRPTVPWRLLFNSTAVRTGCRAIIPDRRLAGPGLPATRPNSPLTCGLGSAAPAADSYDLLAKLPCLTGLDTATAALLSARFTFISPSGVVNGCLPKLRQTSQEQFVDGGYADSSGLATLAGLAPGLTAAVRQYNARAVAAAQAGQPATLVVPVTVYLGNSPQVVPSPTAPGSAPELLAPLDAKSASGDLTTPDAYLQQIGQETAATVWLPCPQAGAPAARPGAGCARIRAAAAGVISKQLVLVAPQTEPQVAAPLGWVLSPASQQALGAALGQDAAGPCRQTGTSAPDTLVYCPAGIGGLRYLLRLVRRP